jgi:hypothetical protein
LINPSECIEVGGLNLASKVAVKPPIPIVATSAKKINLLGFKKKANKITVNNIVGIPLYRKLESTTPRVSKVSGCVSFFTYLRMPETTSRKPDVIGMSCQSVIPMAPTNGVMQSPAELQRAVLPSNNE